MALLDKGGLRLFRLFGIDVFVHWSWAVVAAYQLSSRVNDYHSPVWSLLEYLSLFAIVLMHEFGHALACRSVGGEANGILLWPLGGVAFVSPPPRPGAVLWSIAAGPLVNLVLLPVSFGLAVAARAAGASPDVNHYAETLVEINAGLLVFNLLPIYPFDGGQILQALLWFVIGRGKSLKAVSVIGLGAAAVALAFALAKGSIWIGLLAVFGGMRALAGLRQARVLTGPRRVGFACPACGSSPLMAPLWRCSCGAQLDPFATDGACGNCGSRFGITSCPDCQKMSPLHAWARSPRPGAPPEPPPAR